VFCTAIAEAEAFRLYFGDQAAQLARTRAEKS
jgi:hypothetical protein